jgi:hypothetical protein
VDTISLSDLNVAGSVNGLKRRVACHRIELTETPVRATVMHISGSLSGATQKASDGVLLAALFLVDCAQGAPHAVVKGAQAYLKQQRGTRRSVGIRMK